MERRHSTRRPLSPHLQIYTPMLTMMMSIVHRITGAALYFGMLLLAWWLIAAASGPNAYANVEWFMGSLIGRLILFGYTWALLHHMLGGIRHLIWDTLHGFEPAEREWLDARHADRLDRAHARDLGHRLSRHGRPAMNERAQMRTPLGRVRGLGSAHSGTGHFWHQRLTSVAGVPLTIALIVIVIALLGRNHATAVQVLGSPLVAHRSCCCSSSPAPITCGSACRRSSRITCTRTLLKLVALMANTFFCFAVALASVYAILKLSFGV